LSTISAKPGLRTSSPPSSPSGVGGLEPRMREIGCHWIGPIAATLVPAADSPAAALVISVCVPPSMIASSHLQSDAACSSPVAPRWRAGWRTVMRGAGGFGLWKWGRLGVFGGAATAVDDKPQTSLLRDLVTSGKEAVGVNVPVNEPGWHASLCPRSVSQGRKRRLEGSRRLLRPKALPNLVIRENRPS